MQKIETMVELQSILRSTDIVVRAHLLTEKSVRLVVTTRDRAYYIVMHHEPRTAKLIPATDVPDYKGLGAYILRQHDMKLLDGRTLRYDEVEPAPHEAGNARYNQRLHKMVTDWPAEFVELRVTDPTLGSDSTATLVRSGNRVNRLSDMRQLTYYYVGGSRRSQADIDAHNALKNGVDTTEEIDEGW